MIFYAGTLPFVSLGGTSSAILNSHHEFRKLGFFNILQPVVTLAGVVGFLVAGFGVAGLVVGLAIGPLVNSIVMNVVATHVMYRDGSGLWWQGSLAPMKPYRREFVGVFGWNYIREAVNGFLESAPFMLLGHYRPVQEVGFLPISHQRPERFEDLGVRYGASGVSTAVVEFGGCATRGGGGNVSQADGQGGVPTRTRIPLGGLPGPDRDTVVFWAEIQSQRGRGAALVEWFGF